PAGRAGPGAGRYWQDVGGREGRVHHLVVDPGEMSATPACVPGRAGVPAGSSSTLSVPRGAPTGGTHGRRSSATRRTRIDRSRKIASIAKRMKNIVIDPVLVMRRPSPVARRERGMRPKPLVRK